jgi:hypothetical protein
VICVTFAVLSGDVPGIGCRSGLPPRAYAAVPDASPRRVVSAIW